MEQNQTTNSKINQVLQNQYKIYLEQVANRIMLVCAQDDALNTLKTMQSKQYLLERIKQIVSQVYDAYNQNQVIKLLKQLQTCRVIIQENIQKLNQKQNNCVKKQEKIQLNQVQSNKILQSQNIQLQKSIILQQQQYKFHMRELNQTINFLTNQNQTIKKDSSQKITGIIQNFKLLQQKYRNIYQQKQILEQNIEYEVQKSLKQSIKIKKMQEDLNNFKQKNQKLIKKTIQFEDRQSILNEKIVRLQQSSGRLQEQVKNYQNQIKLIKLIEDKKRQQQNSGYDLNFEEQSKKIKQLEQEQKAYCLGQKDKRILQLQKLKQKLKCQNNSLQMQFHDHRIKCQRQKMQMQTTIKNLILKNQKGIRIAKQQNLKQKQKLIEQFTAKINTQKYQIQQNLKQKINQIQQNALKQKHKYQQSKNQLKALEILFKEKQLIHNSKLNEYEQKNANLKTYLKQLQNKIASKHQNYHQIEKQNQLKINLHEQQVRFLQNQNNRLKKQMEKMRQDAQKINAKIFLLQFSNKKDSNQIINKQLENRINKQLENRIKQLKQNQILLQSELKYMKKQVELRLNQLNQQKLLNQQINKKAQKFQQKHKKIQKELLKQKKRNTQNQINHQKQIQETYKKQQIVLTQMKKQITLHYEHLLKDQHQKIQQITNNDSKQQNKIIVKTLKDTIQDLRTNIQNYQHKIQTLNENKKQLNEQIKGQNQNIEKLQNQLKSMEHKLRQAAERQKQIISFFQAKLHLNKVKFKDFKFQFYLAMKQALGQLKKQLIQINLSIAQMQNQFNNTLQKLSMHIFKQITNLKVNHHQQLKNQKQYYENQIILKLEIDKQEIAYQNQKKNKQKNIQIMTIIAQRQHQLAHLAEKDKLNSKKINQLLQNLHLTQQDLEKIKKQNSSFKQVIQKMNDKVCILQKEKITLNHELKYIIQEKSSLEKQLSQIQGMYMQKLQKCREKYIRENQKLFSKYEREFDKLIGMNSKNKQIGLGMSTISSILSPNLIPTKQNQKVGKDKKLQSLAKQIQLQKKKLELLQGKKVKKNKSKQKELVLTNLKKTNDK